MYFCVPSTDFDKNFELWKKIKDPLFRNDWMVGKKV